MMNAGVRACDAFSRKEGQLERVKGIEPSSSAWKTVYLSIISMA
jgi:hypothetical protein